MKTKMLFLTLPIALALSACGGGGGDDPKPAQADTTAPVITLRGATTVSLESGATFTDSGATALDNVDGIVSVSVTGNVDNNTAGSYTLTYTATDNAGNQTTLQRVVNIVTNANANASDNASDNANDANDNDITSPVITLNGGSEITVNAGDEYVELSATAFDNAGNAVDVERTGWLSTEYLDTYILTYTATDSTGNENSVTRTVIVVDTTPPVITLRGDNPDTVIIDNFTDTYSDYGTNIADNVDYQFDETKTGSVDVNTVGSYTLTYTATDKSGNTSSVQRIVNVIEQVFTSNLADATLDELSEYFQSRADLQAIKDNNPITYTTLPEYLAANKYLPPAYRKDNAGGCLNYPNAIVAETDGFVVVLPSAAELDPETGIGIARRTISAGPRQREIEKVMLSFIAAKQDLLEDYGFDSDFFQNTVLDTDKYFNDYFAEVMIDMSNLYVPMLKADNDRERFTGTEDYYSEGMFDNIDNELFRHTSWWGTMFLNDTTSGRLPLFNQQAWDNLPTHIKALFEQLDDDGYILPAIECARKGRLVQGVSQCVGFTPKDITDESVTLFDKGVNGGQWGLNGGDMLAYGIPLFNYLGKENFEMLLAHMLSSETLTDTFGRSLKDKYADKLLKKPLKKLFLCGFDSNGGVVAHSYDDYIAIADLTLRSSLSNVALDGSLYGVIKHELTHHLWNKASSLDQYELGLSMEWSEGLAIHSEPVLSNSQAYLDLGVEELSGLVYGWGQRLGVVSPAAVHGYIYPSRYLLFRYVFDHLVGENGETLTNQEKLQLAFNNLVLSQKYFVFGGDKTDWMVNHRVPLNSAYHALSREGTEHEIEEIGSFFSTEFDDENKVMQDEQSERLLSFAPSVTRDATGNVSAVFWQLMAPHMRTHEGLPMVAADFSDNLGVYVGHWMEAGGAVPVEH